MNDSELANAFERSMWRTFNDIARAEHQRTQALDQFEEQAKNPDTPEHIALTERLSADDTFWLAIGSGADYLSLRTKTINEIVNEGFYS